MSRSTHPAPIPLTGRAGVVWPMATDPSGVTGPTPKQARGPRWVRVSVGRFIPAGLDSRWEVEQRIVNAAAGLSEAEALTGWAALRWRGAGWLDRPMVELVGRPGSRRRRPGSVMRTASLAVGAEVEIVDGLRVVPPLAALSFGLRTSSGLGAAVNLVDRAAASDLVSLAELEAFLGHQHARGARGVRQARRAVALANENSWSPRETEMRLLWHGLGLRSVVCNTPVFGPTGTHLGTPDLLDLDHGLVGEYDGAAHLTGPQRGRDIDREAAFRRAGLEYVEMTAADLRDPSRLLARTRDALARAGSAGFGPRAWTIVTPYWWRPTVTVVQRRALTPRPPLTPPRQTDWPFSRN